MSGLTTLIIYIAGATVLAYKRASLRASAGAAGALFLIYLVFGSGSIFITALLAISAIVAAVLSIETLRREKVSAPLFSWYRKALPPISETEQEAIDAGTVWWEGELFTGDPDWDKLLGAGRPVLTPEEQAFIDGPVNELMAMVNPWEIHHSTADIPEAAVEHIKKNKFLGMIIPREYGGLDLSAVAQAEILTKLSGAGSVVATFVVVPNSLGPGELLHKYGTEEQKDYYLPRLASGEEIPCFALTGPLAGSDATSLQDSGVVCKGTWEGKEVLGIRLNFEKRYITLAPVATLIGLAFRLKDPDHLIGDVDDYGITCALIPRDTEGMEIGKRHMPIGDPFLNGPIRGKDVFVPLDAIIGGQEMAGKGWRMLVNCLSTGRVISLPSGSNGAAKYALAATSAYTRLRKQFGLPIGEFEGIQKPLARIAGFSYIIDAGLKNTAQAVAAGAKPAVPASILKYHCTELGRRILADAMDIHGGKAVMKGPKNYLAVPYESMPVAITVEGANIMTRNLMIFGQGAIRSHPYVLREMALVEESDVETARDRFDALLFEHIGFTANNAAKSFVHGLSGSLMAKAPIYSPVKRYYQHLYRLSSAFAMVADMAMLIMQSGLKRREMISARLGDLLSSLYLASMVLKQYEDQGNPEEDRALVEWCCQYLFHEFQTAMEEIIQNFPNRAAAMLMQVVVFPLGKHFAAPADSLERKIARLMLSDSACRRRLVDGVYDKEGDPNHLHELQSLMAMAEELAPLESRLKQAIKAGELAALVGGQLIDAALEKGIISESEAATMRDYDSRVMEIIHVDEFEYDSFQRPGPVKKSSARKAGTGQAAKKTTKKAAKKTSRKKATSKSDAKSSELEEVD